MTVADRIKARREELGMTQLELANAIGRKEKSTITKIEAAGDKVSLKNLEKLAKAMHTTVTFLMGFEDEIKAADRKIATDYNEILSDSKLTCAIVDLCSNKSEEQLESAYMLLKVFFSALDR